MAPKKQQKAKDGEDDGPDQDQLTKMLEVHIETLKQRLVMEQERCNQSGLKEQQIRLTEL